MQKEISYNKQEIEEKVYKIIQGSYFTRLPKENWQQMSFSFDLALNSLEMVEIIMQSEKVFQIEFNDNETMEMNSGEKLINKIIEKLNNKKK